MSRWATGPAGARRGVALRALLIAVLALPLQAPATTARAFTPPAAADTASPGAASTAEQPVRIQIARLEPRTLTPGAVITVAGTLTNTGAQPVGHLSLRLQRGPVYTTRDQLTAGNADAVTAVAGPPSPVEGEIGPGASLSFTYSVPAADLLIDRDGVYPALLTATGSLSGSERRLGQQSTYLLQGPTSPAGRTSVSWLWPLVERTHRDAVGRFVDDDLAKLVRPGGRLDRVLAVVERLLPGPGSTAPAVPVTLAVDPAVVEELQLMAAGPYQAGSAPGTGMQAASAFLQRLKAVTAVEPVLALPYGDVDAETLENAGLPEVLIRSLPGSAGGTAHDERARENAGSGATPAAGAPSPAPVQEAAKNTGAGAQILTDALGVRPRTDLAWLPDGPVSSATLEDLRRGGVAQVVLAASALSDGEQALGAGSSTAAAATRVATFSGPLGALVANSGLGTAADVGGQPAGPRVAEQRYLAELALIGLRTPPKGTGGPSVLVTPPRRVDPDPDAAVALLTDAATLPWLQPGAAAGLSPAPGAAARTLAPAQQPAGGLDGGGVADVAAAVALRNDVAGAALGDPSAALAPYDAATLRAMSVSWREDAVGFRGAARALRDTMGRLGDRVGLVAPADGTYSLASSGAPLVLTVRNDLPFAAQVLLRLQTRGSGLELGDIGRQVLEPGQRTTLQVPTKVYRSNAFTVAAALTTPGGRPLGRTVEISVKSTAYGPISLTITLGAAALLGLLFLRRLLRFLRRRRRALRAADEQPGPAPEGAAVPLPPARSPV